MIDSIKNSSRYDHICHQHPLKLTLPSFYIFMATFFQILLFWIVTQCSVSGGAKVQAELQGWSWPQRWRQLVHPKYW